MESPCDYECFTFISLSILFELFVNCCFIVTYSELLFSGFNITVHWRPILQNHTLPNSIWIVWTYAVCSHNQESRPSSQRIRERSNISSSLSLCVSDTFLTIMTRMKIYFKNDYFWRAKAHFVAARCLSLNEFVLI